MKTSTLLNLLAYALLISFAPALKADDKTDLDSLQGTWKVTAAEKGNNTLSAEEIKELKVVITKNKLALKNGEEQLFEAKLTLNPATSPKRLQLKTSEDNSLGIYQLDGDQLKICWDNSIGEQPTEFKGENENGSLINLKLTR